MNFTLMGMVENNGVEPKTFSIARAVSYTHLRAHET